MNDPATEQIVAELAERMRQPIPLDETDFPHRMDESANSAATVSGTDALETGASKRVAPEVYGRHPFEVYVIAYASIEASTAQVEVSRGTVLKSEDDAAGVATIEGLHEAHVVSSGDKLWLHASFTKEGSITSVALVKGTTWTFYPALYKDNETSGNEWITVLCQARASKKDKSDGEEPEPGEFPELKNGVKLVQKTHTHLAAARWCMGAARKLLWGLVPSSGGID